MLKTNVFPVRGQVSYSNDWGGKRSPGATGGTGKHQGTDIFAPRGTPVVAVVDGVVSKVGPSKIGGNRIWINGTYYYAHLDSFAKGLKAGARVKAGQVIGYVGDTGDAKGTPTHLHFGIDPTGGQGASYTNPFPVLERWKKGRASLEPVSQEPNAAPPADPAVAGEKPAELEFGVGVPTGPPLPGVPGPELPGSSEIPYRQSESYETWKLVSPQSVEGRRFFELAATAAGDDQIAA